MGVFLQRLDLLLGLRAWGLLLYSAIPANLVLLGTSKLQLKHWDWLPLLVAIAVPCVMLFLLIRGKHRQWYLTTDLLNIRSVVTTLITLAIVSSMSGCMGMLNGTYILAWPVASTTQAWTPVAECLLLGAIGLIISSTLSMTALAKSDNLPGLPSPPFVTSLDTIRQCLREAQSSRIWAERISGQKFDDLKESMRKANEEFDKLTHFTSDRLARDSLRKIGFQVEAFLAGLDAIEDGANDGLKQSQWEIHFDPNLKEHLKARREALGDRVALMSELRQLRLGD